MRIPFTFSIYMGKQFLIGIGIVFAIITAIILMSDMIETIRRSVGKDIPFHIIVELVFLNLPHVIQEIVPFSILLGGILTFSRMTSTAELIAARSAGISAWQFLTPPLIISLMLGIFLITIFNPFSAILLSRYEQIEGKYLRGAGNISLSSSGLWLKENTSEGSNIIHAAQVNPDTVELYNVTIFNFDHNNIFLRRFDAESANIRHHAWVLNNSLETAPHTPPVASKTHDVPTNIIINELQDSFASPETISFWELPAFIRTLKAAGFSALRHTLHWYSLLVSPFYLCAMVFISASFSLRPPRRGKTMLMMVTGIFVGFVIYFASYIVSAMGMSGSIPIPLAAWAPVIISMLVGATMMLHLEDG